MQALVRQHMDEHSRAPFGCRLCGVGMAFNVSFPGKECMPRDMRGGSVVKNRETHHSKTNST